MKLIKIELELLFDTEDGGMEIAHPLEGSIHELIRDRYMVTGSELYGYEGPFVRVVTSTITTIGRGQ